MLDNTSDIEKRLAIRHECVDLFVKINADKLQVIDLSLDGFSVFKERDKPPFSSSLFVDFLEDNKLNKSMTAIYVGTSEYQARERHHFKFLNSQRPEKLEWLNRHLSKPFNCHKSSQDLYVRQKNVAEMDLSAISSTIQNLKDRQFQLILAAIPILFGLLASIVKFISREGTEVVNDFYYIIPPTTTILSVLFLAVFIQKTESIKRSTVFALILQRHLVMGSFPKCYRGWHDAFENYNHLIRHGTDRGSPFDVNELKEENIITKIPANSFNMLAVGLFMAIPVLSSFLMIYLFYMQVTQENFGLVSYTTVVLVVGAFLVVAVYKFVKKYKELTKGKRSFRYLLVLFSKILKYAPPFDPYSNISLSTHSKVSKKFA